ncbi:hypothetical protein MKZ38_000599 [Zalerion maritima]|uniref:Uncharacterized protein n=1 Tax=Zalerion maritima TaxID=339359 RepID=A0AAD5WSF6_9PEZI|nr:hypothetical protein MKZ38_000599 [Zalerion maritima]
MMGNQNCHAEITFLDNVKWLARFRLTKTFSPPPEIHDYILRNEAATMHANPTRGTEKCKDKAVEKWKGDKSLQGLLELEANKVNKV